jgi:hypothetical protein
MNGRGPDFSLRGTRKCPHGSTSCAVAAPEAREQSTATVDFHFPLPAPYARREVATSPPVHLRTTILGTQPCLLVASTSIVATQTSTSNPNPNPLPTAAQRRLQRKKHLERSKAPVGETKMKTPSASISACYVGRSRRLSYMRRERPRKHLRHRLPLGRASKRCPGPTLLSHMTALRAPRILDPVPRKGEEGATLLQDNPTRPSALHLSIQSSFATALSRPRTSAQSTPQRRGEQHRTSRQDTTRHTLFDATLPRLPNSQSPSQSSGETTVPASAR